MRLAEAVPNFSTSNETLMDDLAAVATAAGALLLDRSADTDHNRGVLTLVGGPTVLGLAMREMAGQAVLRIDLRRHRGVHPRMGALDVAPFVALESIGTRELVECAHGFGERLWEDLRVPVYFYGKAALEPQRERLEAVRRGGFEALVATGGRARRPDVGGPAPHPTAGATAVGVRPFLIAFNVNLATADTGPAKRIAQGIRESSGGYECVKALGLALPEAGVAQVSMNLTDFTRTPPATVFKKIREEAMKEGVEVVESELIGLIPQAALAGTSGEELRIRDFDPDRMILERRLALLLEQSKDLSQLRLDGV